MRTALFTLACCAMLTTNALTVNTAFYPDVCGNSSGVAIAYGNGGQSPYSYLWGSGATTNVITGLTAGTYSVTVTDNLGAQASADVIVAASNELYIGFNGVQPTCPGFCTGVIEMDRSHFGGVPPYNYSTTPSSETADLVTFGGVCGFNLDPPVTITDMNGCTGTVPMSVPNSYYAQTELLQVMPSCQGVDGHIVFQLGFTMLTILTLHDAQGGVLYTDAAPPSQTPIIVTGLAPGDYTIRCTSNEIPGGWCYGETAFTIADLGSDCGRITGRLFIDSDSDCTFDQPDTETAMPYRMLVVEPGPVYGITDAQGLYTINLDEGAYTIENQDADLIPLCPATEPVPFDITSLAPVVIQNMADSSTVARDLELACTTSDARPGFIHHIWLTVFNQAPYLASPIAVTLNFDPLLTFVSSNIGGISTTGQVTWNTGYLQGFTSRLFHVQLQVPADVGLIGSTLSYSASVVPITNETDLADNACGGGVIVTGSYDPNDKTAFTSTGLSDELYFIDQDEWIDYVIRFQNTGTATAINVEVSDTLEAELDPGTMQLLGWSHQLDRVAITPGPVMHWYFDNIYLPDSNANEAASHGFVSFRIKPSLPLLAGTVIENTANIFFDFNPPVITEPSVLTAEFSTGLGVITDGRSEIVMLPNPANERVEVRFRKNIETLRLLAADGRLMQQSRVGSSNAQIDLTGLANGTYVVELTIADGSILREKLIKH